MEVQKLRKAEQWWHHHF